MLNSHSLGINGIKGPGDVHGANFLTLPLIIFQLIIILFNEVQIWHGWLFKTFNVRVVLVQYCLFIWFSCTYFFLRFEHQRLRGVGHINLSARADRYLTVVFIFMTHITCVISLVCIFWPEDPRRNTFIYLISSSQTPMMCLCLLMYFAMFNSYNWIQARNRSTAASKSYNSVGEQQYTSLSTHRSSRDQDQMFRGSFSSGAVSPIPAVKYHEEYSMTPTKNSDHELQALRAERDRLREEVNKINDEFAKFTESTNIIRKEYEEQLDLIGKQKKKLRQLERDNSQLSVLVEVHKETNANAQKTIKSISIPRPQGKGKHPFSHSNPNMSRVSESSPWIRS